MSVSNSKLTKAEKQWLKDFKASFREKNSAFAMRNGVTVFCAANPAMNTAQFTLSVASPYEQKWRRKVGEFHAAMRYARGGASPVPNMWGRGADVIAEEIAATFGY